MTVLSQASIAKARESFFSEGAIDTRVRPEILLSWKRSARLGLNPWRASQPKFVSPNRAEGLRRAAEPVVHQLLRDVGAESAAMLLLNADGVVVERWSESTRINRVLNGTGIEPGRLFDEASAGTTGLGTPLEDGCSAIIEGTEHVLAALDTLTAVGTPIIHPARGTIEGVIDIVGTVGVETSMMVPLVRRAALDIGNRLVSGYAMEDRLLLDAFLNAERRGPRRPMLAINDRLMIGNGPGNALGLGSEHATLWQEVQGALDSDSDLTMTLPGGKELRGRISAVRVPSLVGALIQVPGKARKIEPARMDTLLPERARSETAFDELERSVIRDALCQTGGNRRAAAQVLGISRATLYRKMTRLGLTD